MSASEVSDTTEAPEETRETILVEGGKGPEQADQAIRAAIAHGANIYQMGGRLVSIARDGDSNRDRIRRTPGAPRIVGLSATALRERLTRHVLFAKIDGRSGDIKFIECPYHIAAALVDRGEWADVPELVGYNEAPVIRPDGSLLTDPGYDRRTGLYLFDHELTLNLPTCVTEPSGDASNEASMAVRQKRIEHCRTAALDAYEVLSATLSSLPFKDESDQLAAVAGVMTATSARVIDSVPMTAITAPTPGTGKTLLADAMAIVATGRRAAVMSLGQDNAEAEKRLFGLLLAGDLIGVLDNIERILEGDLICQAISQATLNGRPLGGSTMVRVPARSALVATGNNLVIRGDLNRRTMLVRLDAKCERPETRAFDRDLLAEVETKRGAMVGAVLTIARSYQLAGCPAVADLPAFGGFGDWDLLVRRPLAWLGLGDPLTPARDSQDDDPDRANQRSLFASWFARYGDRPVTAAQVVDDATSARPRFDGAGFDHDAPDLHDALTQMLGEKISARALGYVLRRYRGRIIDDLRLDHAGQCGRNKYAQWRLVKL